MTKKEIINAISVASYLLQSVQDPLIELWHKDDKNEANIKRMVSLFESIDKLKSFIINQE